MTADDGAYFGTEVTARSGSGAFVTGVEARWRCKDGSVIDVELTVSPVYDQDGIRVGASAIARDITEIQRLKAAAEAERERLLAAQEMAHVGSVEHTVATGETWHSEEFDRILGMPGGRPARTGKPSWRGRTPRTGTVSAKCGRAWTTGLDSPISSTGSSGPTGEQRWLHSRIRSMKGADGKPIRFLDTVLDITDRKNAEQILEWQARHDALTGLPNRYMVTEVLQGFLDRAARPVVMFVDVDRFKLINDGIGHGAGDTILVLLGERLKAAVRAGDTVGRFGGDEFVVICENLQMRGAQAVAGTDPGCNPAAVRCGRPADLP